MRGIWGVLLLGGVVAAVGSMVGKRNRNWKTLINHRFQFANRSLERMTKRGRRLIRNMGWA